MGIKVENIFSVPASCEHAWPVLLDLPRVVPCMPGTELTELLDERRFRAKVRMKVGPVELFFSGEGELYDVDAIALTAKLRAKGRDTKGRGGFQADIALSLLPEAEAASRVRVDTDLNLSGSVAQYGRGVGLVREITAQYTAAFAANLAALVAREAGAAGQADPSVAAAPDPMQRPAPISGLSLLYQALKAMVRRWFGAKPGLR